jgi:hypothetical protein
MPNVKTGTVQAPPIHPNGRQSRIWMIVVSPGESCKFDHNGFPHILNGARVNFIDDDDFPGYAEMVWSVDDIIHWTNIALPHRGLADPIALQILERHVMDKLASDRFKRKAQLKKVHHNREQRFESVKADASVAGSGGLTISTLNKWGIT